MNKNIKINTILIISIVLLIFLNSILLSIFFNNRNSKIVEQNRSKEQLTSTSVSNAYLDKSSHLEELNEQYQQGYEDGSANAYEDAFNYHFKVVFPCKFLFSYTGDSAWSSSTKTASFALEYDGGTIKKSTSGTTKVTRGSLYSTLTLNNATVTIDEKDKFTVKFTITQYCYLSWDTSKSATATITYDHGTTTCSHRRNRKPVTALYIATV